MGNLFFQRKLKKLSQAVRSYMDLSSFSNKYKGKRCFIIGNGPSLKKTNLKLLKNEYTFGLNRIYLNYKKMGFQPTFLVSINDLLLGQFYRDFKDLKSIKFFNKSKSDLFSGQKNTHFVDLLNNPNFHEVPYKGVWTGHTVTYVAMQLAYFMGFAEVVLVGVDHSFKALGKPNETHKMTTADVNHFSPDYFKGHKWQLPDLKMSEVGYRLAKDAYGASGRKIVDATIGGKLTIFPKINYNELTKNL